MTGAIPATVLAYGKAATGIRGLDRITGGGLAAGRASLVLGGTGSGKTVLALQSLCHGARNGEPGLFVSFEEGPEAILAHTCGFSWGLADLVRDGAITLLDARLSPEVMVAGSFDLSGLLAGIEALAGQRGARRVVLDGLDVLFALMRDPPEVLRQILEIDAMLRRTGLTAILTAKQDEDNRQGELFARLAPAQYIVDCALRLDQDISGRIATRLLRVLKYRGSAFLGNAYPVVIDSDGLALVGEGSAEIRHKVSTERVSSGVARLDTMLGGGYYRGSSVLISGAPGTAKTTLAGAFADAACRAGERVLFISFDEAADQVARNLRSVGLDLGRHVDSGLLAMSGLRAGMIPAAAHIHRLQSLAERHGATTVVMDPVSALAQCGGEIMAEMVIQSVLDMAKNAGRTILFTTLPNDKGTGLEATPTHVSTVADTWLHLSYAVQGGERNRALTVIKSRGTRHSNQVRELLLTDSGIDLADVYCAGGMVLMGTARYEQERSNAAAQARKAQEARRQRSAALADLDTLKARLGALEQEIHHREAVLQMLDEEEQRRDTESQTLTEGLLHRRFADSVPGPDEPAPGG